MWNEELTEPKPLLCVFRFPRQLSPLRVSLHPLIILHCIFYFLLLSFVCHLGVLFQFGSHKHTFVIITSPLFIQLHSWGRNPPSPPPSVVQFVSCRRRVLNRTTCACRTSSDVMLIKKTVAVAVRCLQMRVLSSGLLPRAVWYQSADCKESIKVTCDLCDLLEQQPPAVMWIIWNVICVLRLFVLAELRLCLHEHSPLLNTLKIKINLNSI